MRGAHVLSHPAGCGDYAGVYFVKVGDHVKVGSANDVVRRRRALETSIPPPALAEPLGWIPVATTERNNHGAEEWRVQQSLAPIHARGEWYQDCEALRKFIAKYAKPWPTDAFWDMVNPARGE